MRATRGARNPYLYVRGCLHDTGATFAPERVLSGSLSWLYICLHDTTTKLMLLLLPVRMNEMHSAQSNHVRFDRLSRETYAKHSAGARAFTSISPAVPNHARAESHC